MDIARFRIKPKLGPIFEKEEFISLPQNTKQSQPNLHNAPEGLATS
jgi:hypothetical protein